jgi:alkylation response protein AidB-like acyl-CoA dehydrogenase
MTQVEQAVGHAALTVGGVAHGGGGGASDREGEGEGEGEGVEGDETWLKVYLYSRAQSVMGGTSQIQRNLVATRILGLPTA